MDVVFLGTPEFAVPSLQALIASPRHRVVGVVSQPDRRAGRGNKLRPPPVKICAEAAGLPLLQTPDVNAAAATEWIRARSPQAGVVVAFGQFLARPLREIPAHGFTNVHASLLPAFRGAAPVHAAIRAGCARTGVSIMRVERRLDAGPVFAREALEIDTDENVGALSERLARLGAALLVDVLVRLEDGAVAAEPQDEAAATHAAKIGAEDRAVVWSLTAREIHDHVRGLTPHPGATARFVPGGGEPFTVRLVQTALVARAGAADAEPGTLLACEEEENGVRVATGDRAGLVVRRLVPAGGREVSGVEFFSGRGRGGGRFA